MDDYELMCTVDKLIERFDNLRKVMNNSYLEEITARYNARDIKELVYALNTLKVLLEGGTDE